MIMTICRKILATLALLAGFAATAGAADLVITNARVFDGSGAEPVNDANISISDGRIVSVGTGAIDTRGATVIDAGGKTVMPGLIEAHVHMTVEFLVETGENGFGYPDPNKMHRSDEDIDEFVAERLPRRLQRFLEAGITSIVDPGSFFPWVVEVRDRINAGELAGPRMFVSGRLFAGPNGHPPQTVCHGLEWCIENLTVAYTDEEQVRETIRMLVAGGVDGLKLVYDGNGDPDAEQKGIRLRKDLMYAIVDEGHRLGVPVTAHTGSIDETAEAIRAGVDGLVHASMMENGSFDTSDGEYLPAMINRYDVAMVPTVGFADSIDLDSAPPAQREMMQNYIENIGPSLRALTDAGVDIVFGTDFEGIGIDPDPRDKVLGELRTLQKGGFSNTEILTFITGNAAKHPFTRDDIGTIKPEFVADIIIVDEDPLENIETIVYPNVVIKGGQIVVDNR